MKFSATLRRLWSVLAIPLIAILLSLVVGAVIIIVSEIAVGHELDLLLPLQAYAGLIQGAVGSETAIINSLVYATPLILGGLSVAFGFRAGLFNIGAQGQFLLGLLGAVWVGVTVAQLSPLIAITLALVGGVLAGAFWGFIPGLLKAVSGAHEVVTTIMLNYVAAFLLAWAVAFRSTCRGHRPRSPETLATRRCPSSSAEMAILDSFWRSLPSDW